MPVLPLSPIRSISGQLQVPGDKSMSHRYVLLGALADGRTRVAHLAQGADVRASLLCVWALGARVEHLGPEEYGITGWGTRGPRSPEGPLDCLNSGTTMRLLLGLLAGYPVQAVLTGDASLSSRPMQRVIAPLEAMGARLRSREGRAPVELIGADLAGITWTPPVASAQIKSAVLLAGLRAASTTTVIEHAATRDHTERAFPLFGLTCEVDGLRITVAGQQSAHAPDALLTVPGDPSSAVVWAAMAAALPGSHVVLQNVSLNPGRLGAFAALARMGASVAIEQTAELGNEPVGTVTVRHGDCVDTTIGADEVPALIDELPVLAACAAHGRRLDVRGAGELRVKESDRITALVTGLRALGVTAEEFPDGFAIDGRASRPLGGTADAAHDHRLVMAFALAGLGAPAPTHIRGADAVAVSYPGFWEDLARLQAHP